jgi:hypothetical protein
MRRRLAFNMAGAFVLGRIIIIIIIIILIYLERIQTCCVATAKQGTRQQSLLIPSQFDLVQTGRDYAMSPEI